jgi:D-arabinose 1-dehydrogenase-like Zn-dependent alcohol dehydrogenase
MISKTKSTMKSAQWDMVRERQVYSIHGQVLTPTQKQKKVVVNDVPIPEAGEGQFLVKIKSASLCHLDLMMDLRPDKDEPVTLGHEGVGHIASIHPSTEGKGFKVGDAIGFLYIVGCCFECEGCMIHNLHCTSGKQLPQGFTTDGFFAEYAVVDWQNAIVLPKNLQIERCAPLFCAGIAGKDATLRSGGCPGWLIRSIPRRRQLRVESRAVACRHWVRWPWPTRNTVC